MARELSIDVRPLRFAYSRLSSLMQVTSVDDLGPMQLVADFVTLIAHDVQHVHRRGRVPLPLLQAHAASARSRYCGPRQLPTTTRTGSGGCCCSCGGGLSCTHPPHQLSCNFHPRWRR